MCVAWALPPAACTCAAGLTCTCSPAPVLNLTPTPTQLAKGKALEACCDLLGVEAATLSASLTRKRIVTPGETVIRVGARAACHQHRTTPHVV